MYEAEQKQDAITLQSRRFLATGVARSIARKMPAVVIVLFLCALLSGIFLPIYSDEVVVKWSLARFFLEDGGVVNLLPQCTTTTGRVVSWVFYPAAIALSAIYANLEPLGLRISGVLFSILWFLLIAGWCFGQTLEFRAATRRFAGLIAFSSLGVMPYMWVLSRSEQTFTLVVLALCLSSLFFNQRKAIHIQGIMALLFSALLSCFFYVHPKSLFFTPFILVAIWCATEHYSRLIRYALIGMSVVLAFQVYRDSSALAACQDAPYVQKMLAANTLLPGMIFTAPLELASAAFHNVISFPGRFLTHLAFNVNAQSGWLPPVTDGGKMLSILNIAIKSLLFVLVIGSHTLAFLIFVYKAYRRALSAPVFLACTLVLSNFINIAFYNIQNFYSATQFIPLSVIVVMLLFGAASKRTKTAIAFYSYAYNCVLVAAVISMITLFSLITPSLIKNSSSEQSVLPGQPLSIPVFNAQSHMDAIKVLGQKCDLPVASAKNVVVDHMTYFNYLRDKAPIHILYISELGFGGDLMGGKMLPFLKGLNSPGMISRCEWIPSEFKGVQQKDDMGYCCVNFKDL